MDPVAAPAAIPAPEWAGGWYYKGSRTNNDDAAVTVHGLGRNQPLPLFLEVENHSPTGFEWGYGGSGPSQLSLALVGFSMLAASQLKLWGEGFRDPLPPKQWTPDFWSRATNSLRREEIRALKQQPALNTLTFGLRNSVAACKTPVWYLPMDDVVRWIEAAMPACTAGQKLPPPPALLLELPPMLPLKTVAIDF